MAFHANGFQFIGHRFLFNQSPLNTIFMRIPQFVIYVACVELALEASLGSGDPNVFDHKAARLWRPGYDEVYETLSEEERWRMKEQGRDFIWV